MSPLWETLAAARILHVKSHNRPIYEPWVASREHLLGDLDLDVLRAVQPHVGHTPDFLTPPPRARTTKFEAELARVRSTPAGRVVKELRRCRDAATNPYADQVDELLRNPIDALRRLADALARAWHALLEPDWFRIRRVLDADVVYRGQQLTAGGLTGLFDGLHPSLSWQGDRLVISRRQDDDRDLSGAGLLLVPSAFNWPHLSIVVDTAYQPTLVYPGRGVASLWADKPPPPDRLERLLGRSRASILVALDVPASTTELASRHELAIATVAEHLAVLREAGLAVALRTGRQVHYSRTSLGQALVAASIE